MFNQEKQQIASEIIRATVATVMAIGSAKAFPVVLDNLVKLGWDAEEAAAVAEMMISKINKGGHHVYKSTVADAH